MKNQVRDLQEKQREKKRAAGRLGGLATFRKHGRNHMQDIGAKGGMIMHTIYKLTPAGTDDFALVHRLTGKVKAFLSGRPLRNE